MYFAWCWLCLFGGWFSCGCFNSVVVLDDVISFGVRKVCYVFGCLVYYYLLFCCLVGVCVVCILVFCLRGVGWLFMLA